MLGGVILVQQIEGHVLQPFLMGRFVSRAPARRDRRDRRAACSSPASPARWSPYRWPRPATPSSSTWPPTPTSARTTRRGARRGLRGRRARPLDVAGRRPAAPRTGRPDDDDDRCLTMPEPVTLADIEAARELLEGVAVDDADGGVALALRAGRRTGVASSARTSSAPARSRSAAPTSGSPGSPRRSAPTASSPPRAGNHAQGVALAAQHARHQVHRLHARGRADPQGEGDPRRTAPTWSSTAATSRTRWSRPAPFADGDRRGADPPLRPRRHRRRPGHARARDPRAGARRTHRAGADRRRRAARRHRDRDQGAAPRRTRGRRAGRGRRGLPRLARGRAARCRWSR